MPVYVHRSPVYATIASTSEISESWARADKLCVSSRTCAYIKQCNSHRISTTKVFDRVSFPFVITGSTAR